MKNELFSIEIDNRNGCIKSIVNNNDKDNMNWVAKGGDWAEFIRLIGMQPQMIIRVLSVSLKVKRQSLYRLKKKITGLFRYTKAMSFR